MDKDNGNNLKAHLRVFSLMDNSHKVKLHILMVVTLKAP